jgi:hypothetical protein
MGPSSTNAGLFGTSEIGVMTVEARSAKLMAAVFMVVESVVLGMVTAGFTVAELTAVAAEAVWLMAVELMVVLVLTRTFGVELLRAWGARRALAWVAAANPGRGLGSGAIIKFPLAATAVDCLMV